MKKIEVDFKLLVSDGSITDGLYEEFDDYIEISFTEETQIKANTKVDIYKDKVMIQRMGEINMEMEYIMGMDTTLHLTTDFNYQLSMNNYTKYLEINENSLQIVYQTETDKEQNLTHNLFLKWADIN
mgnify:FL=1